MKLKLIALVSLVSALCQGTPVIVDAYPATASDRMTTLDTSAGLSGTAWRLNSADTLSTSLTEVLITESETQPGVDPTPEPITFVLIGLGLAAAATVGKWRFRTAATTRSSKKQHRI